MYGNNDETTNEKLEYVSPFSRITESRSEDTGLHHDHSLSYENKFGTNDRKLTASIDLNFEEDDPLFNAIFKLCKNVFPSSSTSTFP